MHNNLLMQTPGFKLQIGNTNIMSLQQKMITTQQQVPSAMTMIQPNAMPISSAAELKRLSSSIKYLKPIAPKPPVNVNYTNSVIKPNSADSATQASSAGSANVCHHVLPFGTTIKVTAGNEQMPIPISKPQHILQQSQSHQHSAQQQQQQLQQAPIQIQPQQQQPQSPQPSTLIKHVHPVSPASIAPPLNPVLSPNQSKVIINKIIYKTAENHLGPAPPAGQPRIIPGTPPLSPVSLKRKIIITGPASRKRLPSPASISQRPAQIIVQTATPPLALMPRTAIENIPSTVQDIVYPSNNSINNNSSNTISVKQIVHPVTQMSVSQPSLLLLPEEEKPESTMQETMQTEELPDSCEADQEYRTVTQSSSQADVSEAEVSSTTTEQATQELPFEHDKKDESETEEDEIEPIEMDLLQSLCEYEQAQAVNYNGNTDGEQKQLEEADKVEDPYITRPSTPDGEEQKEQLEGLWSEQMKSPRLQKRAHSEYQQLKSSYRSRRLSEPANREEAPNDDEVPPIPKPLSVIKRSNRRSASRKSASTRSIHSSLLCSEKFDESDESRSIKTSMSSLHTISPPKKEDTSSESPPVFEQEKMQVAIEVHRKPQNVAKSHNVREKTRSESRSVADREEKEEKDYIEGDFGSTPSDLIKWDDGIGYMRASYLHFQFNQFGLVEPMDLKEYVNHVKTNIYDSVKEPLPKRQTIGKSSRNKRKSQVPDAVYRCRTCRCKGNANEFATPEYCSVACMKQSKNGALLSSIARSKSLQRKGLGSSESELSTNTPLPTSDDDSLSSSLNFSNAFKDKTNLPLKDVTAKTPQDIQFPMSDHSNVPKFFWEPYLSKAKGTPSPLNLFVNPYPSGPNKFRTGMKLEAIDPENNSLFCVCTIVEVRGYRMRLSFDGYSQDYDFWVNADSLDIFPPSWCRNTGRTLQPPYGHEGEFRWSDYITKTHSMAASKQLFTHLNSTSNENKFEIGMCLEADDLKKSGKVCVASVSDKIDNRILVHFDGWDERYDYWVDIHSPYIHYINWHQENGYNITAPPDWNKGSFEWAKYIRMKSRRIGKSIIQADKSLFVTRYPIDFENGMKLEVVDRKNQMLIRPATVVATDGYEIKVCFDGWPNFYSFWIEDDSSDIHPVNWCKRTNHPIEFPADYRPASIKSSCEIPYCLGQGNARNFRNRYHKRSIECPYRSNNWLSEDRKRLRIAHEQIITSHKYNSQQETLLLGAPLAKKIKKEPEDALPNVSTQTAPASTELAISPPKATSNTNVDPLMKIAMPVITDFGPRLKQSYELWLQTSKILDRCTEGLSEFDLNPLRWSVEEVAKYVECLPGCTEMGKQIRDEKIDGSAFLSLTRDDLVKYLDIKLGPAVKLYNRIIHLRQEVEKHFVKF
ncbi:lethal(3)malignant brain tumor-like protein 3 isoform X2 [Wyeomyia smithii]|uniref:lethal(3)malignant brain tumor-like protein 3 isoform X2 n=1 Tax=Wyeomyia smithii TaxID=174621 RepID=UPI002467E08D|nr:lethal(3)malignant brain tumor-like protein 3 isoform X2 [Wyeomyia smithii]